MKNENFQDMVNPLAETMQASIDFWGQMASSGSSIAEMYSNQAVECMENGSFAKGFLGNPAQALCQTLAANFLGYDINGFETLTRTNQEIWNNFISTGHQWSESLSGIEQFNSLLPLDDTSRDIISTFKTAFENVFGKFTNIPQLGLTRSYQEKMLQMFDKYNLFQSNISELGMLLYLPVKNAFKTIRQELLGTIEGKKYSGNIKDTYKRWVEILEQNFMTLYKSPEYTKEMAKTIQAMEGYIKVRDDILSDCLKLFPIPTQKDAEGVYKDIYELKKKVRKLEKQLSESAQG